MISKYFNEMATAITNAIGYCKAISNNGISDSNLVLAMSVKTYTKLHFVYDSYSAGSCIKKTKNDPNEVGTLFGLRIEIDEQIEDGHVCLLEKRFEYIPSMEDWWEN